MMPRYVQHISGIGAQWKLHDRTRYNSDHSHMDWCVYQDGCGTLFLPKSEYVEVPAPEVWLDVTADCELFADDGFHGLSHEHISRYQSTQYAEDYRLRKVHLLGEAQVAFVIERTAQP